MQDLTTLLPLLAIAVIVAVVVLSKSRGKPAKHAPALGPLTATIYSASDCYGGYFDPPGVLQRYTPDPVAMISAAGTVPCINRSVNGLKLAELLAGGPVVMNVPELGAPGAVVRPLREQLADDASAIVVIGAGMVDCLFTEQPLQHYLANVREAVGQVRAAGKVPVLRGFNRFAPNELMTPQRLERLASFNAALQHEAATSGVDFIDVHAVSFDPASDICGDGLHPRAGYHARIATYTAARLADVAARLQGQA